MLPKVAALAAYGIALLAIYGSYTQVSALRLGQDSQPFYWSRRGTRISGLYRGGQWEPTPNRRAYSDFRGGGSGAGK